MLNPFCASNFTKKKHFRTRYVSLFSFNILNIVSIIFYGTEKPDAISVAANYQQGHFSKHRQQSQQNERNCICTKQNKEYQALKIYQLEIMWMWWCSWNSYLKRHLIYHHKNYQLNAKEIITYLTPWKVIFMVSHQKNSCGKRYLTKNNACGFLCGCANFLQFFFRAL